MCTPIQAVDAALPPLDSALFARILDYMQDGVYLVDLERRITYWSQGAERLTGFSATTVTGRFCHDNLLRHVDETGRALCGVRCPLRDCMSDGVAREALVYLHHAEGHRVPVVVRAAPVRDASGTITGAVEVFSDGTALATLQEHARDLEAQALLDPLTGVGNRRFLVRELEARCEERRRYGWPAGVLLFDVDHFKLFNDRWGHATGDEVLRVVARTVATGVRGFDVVGRWGGEEFVVLLRNVDGAAMAEIAERLRALVATSSVRTESGHATVTVSIGATLLGDGESGDDALARADAAMYESKVAGRDRVTIG